LASFPHSNKSKPLVALGREFLGVTNKKKEDVFIFIAHKTKLMAWSMEGKEIRAARGDAKETVTCLATNGHADIVATGHADGVIQLWHRVSTWLVSGGQNTPTCQKLHWHAHSVTALVMSSAGEYLHSGGEEAVLVTWEIATNTKTFIPRLGAPIVHLSSSQDEPCVSISTSDNTIRVYNTASLKCLWTLKGICVSQNLAFLGSTTRGSDDCYKCKVIMLIHIIPLLACWPPALEIKPFRNISAFTVQCLFLRLDEVVLTHAHTSFTQGQ